MLSFITCVMSSPRLRFIQTPGLLYDRRPDDPSPSKHDKIQSNVTVARQQSICFPSVGALEDTQGPSAVLGCIRLYNQRVFAGCFQRRTRRDSGMRRRSHVCDSHAVNTKDSRGMTKGSCVAAASIPRRRCWKNIPER